MASTHPTARNDQPARLRPRVKVWFEAEGTGYGFGAGLIAILQAVERTGSIKESAASQGLSYRHVWSKIKRAEQALGVALVETRVGGRGSGRSALTESARRIVQEFLDLRQRMFQLVDRKSSRG